MGGIWNPIDGQTRGMMYEAAAWRLGGPGAAAGTQDDTCRASSVAVHARNAQWARPRLGRPVSVVRVAASLRAVFDLTHDAGPVQPRPSPARNLRPRLSRSPSSFPAGESVAEGSRRRSGAGVWRGVRISTTNN